jgi:hypothetical protein
MRAPSGQTGSAASRLVGVGDSCKRRSVGSRELTRIDALDQSSYQEDQITRSALQSVSSQEASGDSGDDPA